MTTLSRRQLLQRASAAAMTLGAGTGVLDPSAAPARASRGATLGTPSGSWIASQSGQVVSFRSRPDLLAPVIVRSGSTPQPGCLFIGPGVTAAVTAGDPPPTGFQQGPMIIDGGGHLAWFAPLTGAKWVTNVRVQEYQGEPVLTYWEGHVRPPGLSKGEGVILDRHYREIARVRAGHGRAMDNHEFRLTERGTALIICFPVVEPADLSPVGGPVDGSVYSPVIQEVEVSTGRVLLDWNSIDHIPVTGSHEPYAQPYDYLHANSVDVLPDGNLLVSGRATWALYKLERGTGRVMWQLGGTGSDFRMGTGAQFAWQHDAAYVDGAKISIFDDQDGVGPATAMQSRAIILSFDETRRTADLHRAYAPPTPILADYMGSVQVLPGGDVHVGWVLGCVSTDYTADGHIIDNLAARDSATISYRSYRSVWHGVPHEPPALAVRKIRDRGRPLTIAYASWNGATTSPGWRVRAGSSRRDLRIVGTVHRHGFETAIPLHGVGDGWVTVTALDGSGSELAQSAAVRI